MLAVYPGMDALQRANSFNSINSRVELMRQPSAEDLDAAHQLVSSARGERSGNFAMSEGISRHDEPRQQPSSAAATETPRESVEKPVSGNNTSVAEEPQGGQICRYVDLWVEIVALLFFVIASPY